MLIANFKNLARGDLRKKALLIAEAGYEAIDIDKLVNIKCQVSDVGGQKHLIIKSRDQKEKIALSDFNRVFVVGIGKGSALASESLAKILGKNLTECIALDIKTPSLNSKSLILNSEFLVGTHPFPSKQNITATQKIIKLVKNLNKDDLLITFICGGGSALLCESGKELKNLISVTKSLTRAGANILELNLIRKHLSGIKAGGLARMAYPATVISLIVSDVLGDDLSMVASGPTVFDKTKKEDAEKILKKYFPRGSAFNSALFRALNETPKDKKYFEKVKNILFLSNREPILAMAEKAEELGFNPKIHSLKLKGEAKDSLLPLIKKVNFGQVILAGGETTVTLEGRPKGKGGRNIEAVLGAVSKAQNAKRKARNDSRLAHDDKLIVMSFASDGRDNTEAAGAVADSLTTGKAGKLNIDPGKFLDMNDSFGFFEKTGDLIFVEPKTFNVADLMLVLSASKE